MIYINSYRFLPKGIYHSAKVAYSLRELYDTWKDRNVVEVIVGTSGPTQSFTALQVADGTLEEFVF